MKFGLIGHPIAHSLSPALFKAGYDGRYQYELIETSDFEEAYQRFLDGYDGINVTAPFKELAIVKADILSEECLAVKATNLLVKTPEGIKAYNSAISDSRQGPDCRPRWSWKGGGSSGGIAGNGSDPDEPYGQG